MQTMRSSMLEAGSSVENWSRWLTTGAGCVTHALGHLETPSAVTKVKTATTADESSCTFYFPAYFSNTWEIQFVQKKS